jgi:hypothetical protein
MELAGQFHDSKEAPRILRFGKNTKNRLTESVPAELKVDAQPVHQFRPIPSTKNISST